MDKFRTSCRAKGGKLQLAFQKGMLHTKHKKPNSFFYLNANVSLKLRPLRLSILESSRFYSESKTLLGPTGFALVSGMLNTFLHFSYIKGEEYIFACFDNLMLYIVLEYLLRNN